MFEGCSNLDLPEEDLSAWDVSRVINSAFMFRGVTRRSYDSLLSRWNVRCSTISHMECTGTLTGHSSYVNSVAWSPDGKTIATGSNDESVKLWDAHTRECTGTLTGHSSRVLSVAWSPDGKTIATGSWDKSVKLWDAHTRECTGTLTGHSNWVNSVG